MESFILIEALLLSIAFFFSFINTFNYETYTGKFLYEARNFQEFFSLIKKNLSIYFNNRLSFIGAVLTFVLLPVFISLGLSFILNDAGKVFVVVLTIIYVIVKAFKLYYYNKPAYIFRYKDGEITQTFENKILGVLISDKFIEKALIEFLQSAKEKGYIEAEIEMRIDKIFPKKVSLVVYGKKKLDKNGFEIDCFDKYLLIV